MSKVITFLFLVTLFRSNINTILNRLKIIKLDAIDSTNNYLKELSKQRGLNDPTLVVANHQTHGKGQHGNNWVATAGENLTMSLFMPFSALLATEQIRINWVVAVELVTFLNELNIGRFYVKWPNDILSANKKIAGILIENKLSSKYVSHSVVGIGLNVNQQDFKDLPKAGSLMLLSGKEFDTDEMAKSLGQRLVNALEGVEHLDFMLLKETYEQYLFGIHQVSTYKIADGSVISAITKGVDIQGRLCLETDAGLRKFQPKEITLHY